MTLGELRAVNSKNRIGVVSAHDGHVIERNLTKEHSYAMGVTITAMYLDIILHQHVFDHSLEAVMVCFVRDDEWNKAKAGGTE